MGEVGRTTLQGTRIGAAGNANRNTLTATLLALVIAMIAAGVVWEAIAERHRRDLAEYFEFEGAEVALRIEERFRAYRQVLRGARAFVAAARGIERTAWRDYVRELQLDEKQPGIVGVGFARWLLPEALAAHVRAVRAEGFRNYRVWPAGPREAYSAIEFLEPFDWRNQRAFGFDMYSDPVRREAMARAVRTGAGAITGKVTLVQETGRDRQAGVLLYLPVFARDLPTASEEDRWAALEGWVYSPFRMNELVAGILGQHADDIRMQIYDGEQTEAALLYDSHPGRLQDTDHRPVQLRRIELDGRTWILAFQALPGFTARFEDRPVELFAIGLIGLLFVGVTWSFSTARERARELGRISDDLRRSEARYSALVNLAHEGIASTDDRFRLDFVNPRLAEMLGAPATRLHGCPLDTFWSTVPESRPQIVSRLRCGLGSRYEVSMIGADGSRYDAIVSDAPLADEAGRFKGAIVMIADISERKAAERRVEHLATHDTLTGVPNRRRFGELLTQTLDRARRYGHRFALLFVDLDRFKEVNDGHGHQVGDRLLVEAVTRMMASLRVSDSLGRRGGDEFVVLLPEIDSTMDAEVVAEKIRHALAQPFILDGVEARISSSIGVVFYPEHGDDEHVLVRRADAAMYRAKSDGRNCVRAFTD